MAFQDVRPSQFCLEHYDLVYALSFNVPDTKFVTCSVVCEVPEEAPNAVQRDSSAPRQFWEPRGAARVPCWAKDVSLR